MREDVSIEKFVSQQLQSSKYHSYEEMVEAGFYLRQEREAELDRIVEKLRPAAERFKRGEPGIPFDAEEVIRRGQERLATEQARA